MVCAGSVKRKFKVSFGEFLKLRQKCGDWGVVMKKPLVGLLGVQFSQVAGRPFRSDTVAHPGLVTSTMGGIGGTMD